MMSDRLKLTTGKTELDFISNVFLRLHILCSIYIYICIMLNHIYIYTYIYYGIYIYNIYLFHIYTYIYIIDAHIMCNDIETK